MSAGEGNPALKDLKLLIIAFAVLWIIWYFTGGPGRSQEGKPFIKPTAPLDSGQTYGPNDFVNPNTP